MAMKPATTLCRLREPIPRAVRRTATVDRNRNSRQKTDRYGIVVFSHLRWGFVWQRPQQFLSRFAKKHKILFVEEPFFDLPAGAEPRLDFHRVMPNVTVICPHFDRALEPQSNLAGAASEIYPRRASTP